MIQTNKLRQGAQIKGLTLATNSRPDPGFPKSPCSSNRIFAVAVILLLQPCFANGENSQASKSGLSNEPSLLASSISMEQRTAALIGNLISRFDANRLDPFDVLAREGFTGKVSCRTRTAATCFFTNLEHSNPLTDYSYRLNEATIDTTIASASSLREAHFSIAINEADCYKFRDAISYLQHHSKGKTSLARADHMISSEDDVDLFYKNLAENPAEHLLAFHWIGRGKRRDINEKPERGNSNMTLSAVNECLTQLSITYYL